MLELITRFYRFSNFAVGIDRSVIALSLAATRNASDSVAYVCGDVTSLPFCSDTFELVTAFGVLEHTRDHQQLLSEIHRVLKPGGKMLLTSSNARSALQIKNFVLDRMGKYRYGFQRNWTLADLRAEIEKYFFVTDFFVAQGDADMRAVQIIDKTISRIVTDWGRYVCFSAEKMGAVRG